MRVAVVTHYFPNSAMPWQGHSAYETLKDLQQHCELHVFCALPEYPRWFTPRTARKAFRADWRPGLVNVTYLPYGVLPVLSRPFNGEAIARAVLPHVRAYQPDVILNYVVYPQGFAAVRVAKALGVPSVLTAIGSDLNRISDRFSKILTKYALRSADVITTVSHQLAETAVDLGAERSRVFAILNGCDTATFRPRDRVNARVELGLDPAGRYVLYVGRLDVRKGLLELADAVASLRDRQPKLRLIVIGDGPDENKFRQRLKVKGSESVTLFVAPCSSHEVATYMAASDLVTLPSYMEGCPNVVVEALCCGRPVVATRVGGIPELMDNESGRLLPARDAGALARSIDDVLNIAWSSEEIAARHRRSWGDVADDLYGILARVVTKVTS